MLFSVSEMGGAGARGGPGMSMLSESDKGGSYLNDITSGFSSFMAKTKEVIRDPHNNNPLPLNNNRNMHEIYAMRQNDEK